VFIEFGSLISSRAWFVARPRLTATCGCEQRPRPESESTEAGGPPTVIRGDHHYDLGLDEGRGGHTLSRHVARIDEQLRQRLAREQNIALLLPPGSIGKPWPRRFGQNEVGYIIGRSLLRGEARSVTCTNALIVLRPDGPDSFYGLTAYPQACE
jgi:hypothetical protein